MLLTLPKIKHNDHCLKNLINNHARYDIVGNFEVKRILPAFMRLDGQQFKYQIYLKFSDMIK